MSNDRGVTRRQGLRTAAAAAIAVPLLTTAGSTAPTEAQEPATGLSPQLMRRPVGEDPVQLRVMTFNLRVAGTTGAHRWTARRPVMRALLHQERPHVLGTQEGLYPQLRDIAADLGPAYDWIGTGRMGGSRDEFVAVIYDTGRLAPVEYDHFWLSDSPYLIASNSWGGAWPRMVTWVRFRDLAADGREFYVLNTHLDSASQYARQRGAQLIGERIGDLDGSLPLVVTGDFNAPAHKNPVYGTMLGAGLVDTWEAAAVRGPLYSTFTAFRPPVPGGDRIDWILATPGVTTRWAAVNAFSVGGRLPSDHLPVQALLNLG